MNCVRSFEWYSYFKNKISVDDLGRSGQPSTGTPLKNVNKIWELVNEDCWRTIQEYCWYHQCVIWSYSDNLYSWLEYTLHCSKVFVEDSDPSTEGMLISVNVFISRSCMTQRLKKYNLQSGSTQHLQRQKKAKQVRSMTKNVHYRDFTLWILPQWPSRQF